MHIVGKGLFDKPEINRVGSEAIHEQDVDLAGVKVVQTVVKESHHFWRVHVACTETIRAEAG
jgi:hypothetical protein